MMRAALVPALGADAGGRQGERGVAQLTELDPDYDGADPAPLAELQLALRTWRPVVVRRMCGPFSGLSASSLAG